MRDERCHADVILDVVFDHGLLFLVVTPVEQSDRDVAARHLAVTH